jgi:hypothetical protein
MQTALIIRQITHLLYHSYTDENNLVLLYYQTDLELVEFQLLLNGL